MTATPKLGLLLMATNTANKETVFNEALISLEAIVCCSVINMSLTTPPVSPADGDFYIPAAGSTGAWSGLSNKLVFYYSGWRSMTPYVGMRVFDQNSGIEWRWTGSAWTAHRSIEMNFSIFGTPTISVACARRLTGKKHKYLSNMGGSYGYAVTPPTGGAVDFDVQKNGASVGTISFADGANTATFTMASPATFVPNDRLEIIAPANLWTMADITLSLVAPEA